MRVTEIFMTPELAAQMLSKNERNRPIRKTTVQAYAADMAAGRWEQTHQAIAVDAHGKLLDGQHRLSAVIVAQWSGTMLLATYGKSEETMQLPVDRGVRRTAFDVLQRSRPQVEIASRLLAYTIYYTRSSGNTPLYVIENVLQMHETKIDRIHKICTANKRIIGAATTLAALLLTAYAERSEEESEQSLEQYRLFFEQRYDGMWPHVQAFNGYLITGNGASSRIGGRSSQVDIFLRVYLAFDITRKNCKVCRISNYDGVKQEIHKRAMAFIGPCLE